MYDNKVCPFCKTTFSATDDIVVCSSCEMPHHKDCWVEHGGCTTFGCMGTINAVSGQVDVLLQPDEGIFQSFGHFLQ